MPASVARRLRVSLSQGMVQIPFVWWGKKLAIARRLCDSILCFSLTKDKNDEELNISVTNHFSRWGELLNVKVLKDWMERPYAFVQYEASDEVRGFQENILMR